MGTERRDARNTRKTPVLVSRSEGGDVCATANTCTHVGGPLDEGGRDGNVVTRPWHGSRFDLCSGEVPQVLGGEPLALVDVLLLDPVAQDLDADVEFGGQPRFRVLFV